MTTILRGTDILRMTKAMNSDTQKSRKVIYMDTPLKEEKIKMLRSGDLVYLSGTIYGARDAAHKRMVDSINVGRPLPIKLKDATIFYVGPSPTPPGRRSGSIGPTTAARMDGLTKPLLELGLRAMIGKGKRSPYLKNMCSEYRAVYFSAPGGTAAYLSSKICSIESFAYRDLGAEAIYKIKVKDFPVFVAYDIYGGDIFEEASAG
jgi:fumarate hydratase subunit beta